MMQNHLDKTRSETVAIRTQVDRARRVLEGLGSLRLGEQEKLSSGRIDEESAGEELALRWEREIWAAADAEFAS